MDIKKPCKLRMAFLAYYAKASGQELVDMMVASDFRDAKYEELKKKIM